MGVLERAYLVERAGQDKRGNITWGSRQVRARKPGKRFLAKMVVRHLEYFAPLTLDELVYDLAIDKDQVSAILGDMESRGILSSGSFTELDLQFMLAADRMALQGGTDGDIILQPQVENYLLTKHFRDINSIDEHFDRYGVVWMPQDLLARGKNRLYNDWLKRRRNGDILNGRFLNGSVCFVRKGDAQMFIDAYRREGLDGAEAGLLGLIEANPGIDMFSLSRKAELPSAKVKELMDKLDVNMFITRRFSDRESWSSTNHYQALNMGSVPENRDMASEKIIRIMLKAYAPIALRSLAYATGFSMQRVKTVLRDDMASGKVLEIQIAEGSKSKLLLPADELAALRSMPTEEYDDVRILTLYDPLTQHHRVELRRRFGDAWYFPIFQGARLIGMMEMWEMSGCIDIRQLVLDDITVLPEALKALDAFSVYYRLNLMDVIRFKNVLGTDVQDLGSDIIKIFENCGYIRIRDWLVKGNVEDAVVNESQFISYVLWKNHVLPDRRFYGIQEGLRVLGGFRSDEAASLRCRTTVPLKKLHRQKIVGYGQLIPKVLTYALPQEIALHKSAIGMELDEQMSQILQMIREDGPVKWRDVSNKSPLGYQNTMDTKQKLTGSLHILRDAQNRYVPGPETSMDRDIAREKVIRGIFHQFGVFSAEHLAMYTKGQFKMFELRSILDQLELDGFLTKGYFLEGSDSLHWLVKSDLGKLVKKPAKFQTVITERDRLAAYLHPFVRQTFGIGSSWIVIENGRLIAAARMRRKKDEFIMKELFGDQKAWHTMKNYSARLGKRMRREEDIQPEIEEEDDVVDWYERYVRPGGK
jgi:ATP-dependent Lhr-like helicase